MTTIDTYTLEIIRDDPCGDEAMENAIRRGFPAQVAEAEENITDLLPHGYRARISHWSEGDDDDE